MLDSTAGACGRSYTLHCGSFSSHHALSDVLDGSVVVAAAMLELSDLRLPSSFYEPHLRRRHLRSTFGEAAQDLMARVLASFAQVSAIAAGIPCLDDMQFHCGYAGSHPFAAAQCADRSEHGVHRYMGMYMRSEHTPLAGTFREPLTLSCHVSLCSIC